MGTSAKNPMAVDPSLLTPDDQQKFQMQDAYLADLYWKGQGHINKYLLFDIGTHLDSDKTYSDNHSRLQFVGEADLLATKHVNLVSGTVFIGPAVLFTTYTPYEVEIDHRSKGVFLPGGLFGYDYGQAWGNSLKFKIAYYESQKDNSVFQMNFDLQKQMHLVDAYFIFGFEERDVRNAVLPQDRFPLSGPDHENVWIGLSKIYHASESNHQISAVFGNESITYDASQPDYKMDSNYVGLRYKLATTGGWNVNLGGSYYFQRIY